MAVRLFIIDDDDAFRETIERVLRARGYDVVGQAGTVADARAAVAALRPDALLVDVHLPDGNGIDFAGELTRLSADQPRILLTSSDAGSAPTRLVEASGATGFVAKTELIATDLQTYLG
jgi:DNA-binding NarL/FixJ family response regulator